MNSIVTPTLMQVYKLFNFIYRKFYPKPPVVHAVVEQLKKETPESNSGDGVFTFHGYGFSVKIGLDKPIVFWADVHAIFAFEEERSGTTCVCLEVFYGKGESFKVSEYTAGWIRFCEKLVAHFPMMDKSWLSEVGGEKKVLVYEKSKRVLEEVERVYYPVENVVA